MRSARAERERAPAVEPDVVVSVRLELMSALDPLVEPPVPAVEPLVEPVVPAAPVLPDEVPAPEVPAVDPVPALEPVPEVVPVPAVEPVPDMVPVVPDVVPAAPVPAPLTWPAGLVGSVLVPGVPAMGLRSVPDPLGPDELPSVPAPVDEPDVDEPDVDEPEPEVCAYADPSAATSAAMATDVLSLLMRDLL